jgi:uncharacterized protein (DUF952 family)
MIVHVCSLSAWSAARTSGMYKAESLATEGFIHFSRWDQLPGTVARYYAGKPDLVVLVVDESPLDDLRVEVSPSTGESFPHLYGPLPATAVTEVLPLTEALERARA